MPTQKILEPEGSHFTILQNSKLKSNNQKKDNLATGNPATSQNNYGAGELQTPRARCQPKSRKEKTLNGTEILKKGKPKGTPIQTTPQNLTWSIELFFDVTASSVYFSEKLTPP